MSLDQGLGDVITSKKNVHLFNDYTDEKLSAVKHANGRDWWIVIQQYVTNNFYVYLLTLDTITLSSLQAIGSVPGNGGEMVFSSTGDKIGLVGTNGLTGIINLFDFDRCSGTISNFIDLSDLSIYSYYGCSFSPDGSKFYASSFVYLYQFNLNDSNIMASKTLIWTNPYYTNGGPDDYILAQHQLTPNEKIFITLGRSSSQNVPDTFINKNLCVINEPNELGSTCDFEPNSFYLGGHHVDMGLPNSPNYNLGPLPGSPCDTVYTSSANNDDFQMKSLIIYPNPLGNSAEYHINYYQPGNHELTIYDLTGKAISSYHLHIPNGHLDMSNFQPGYYLIKLTRNGKMISTSKFIKN